MAERLILIVDDCPDDREIYQRLLRRAGPEEYRFVEAGAGEAGLELALSQEPDCILLDFNLPDLNGLEFLDALAQRFENRERPSVVMLTGEGSERVAVEAMKRGAQDYALKGDLTSETLQHAVANGIEKAELQHEIVRQQDELEASYRDLKTTEKDLRVAHKVAQHRATHDGLTDLANRELLCSQLEKAVALARRNSQFLAVLFIDLDGFKQVNDTLGHAVGDELLREVARRLEASVRESDVVSRLGGDEFIVVLFDPTEKTDVGLVAEKLLGVLERPYTSDTQELVVTASIGAAVYPDDGDTAETLLRRADAAMYTAKNDQRNAYRFYTDAMNRSTRDLLKLETDLRNAMRRNELELYYQPQLDISTGAVIGAEALLRWNHPEQGMVGPDRFLPIAERNGLIVDIGDWVVREALTQRREWNRMGMERFPLSVNASRRQFADGSFARRTEVSARELEIDVSEISVEVTESYLMDDVEGAINQLSLLRELGIRIAIDDFGTGYSSLGALAEFPLDELKIDRCFVRDIHKSTNRAAIASGIVAIARGLELDLVAEGVETGAEEAYMVRLGCTRMQGFLYAKPMPVADFQDWIAAR